MLVVRNSKRLFRQTRMVLPCATAESHANIVRTFATKGGYLAETEIPTYHYQDSLPKIPIPPLEKTIDRYLASAAPLVGDEQLKVTTRIAEEFREGRGKTLNSQLVARDKSNYTSYYNEFWGNMYLEDRNTLLRHTPYITWAADPSEKKMTQSARATNLIVSSVAYFRTLRDEKMVPVVYHTKPEKTESGWFKTVVKLLPRKVRAYFAIALGAYPLDMTNMGKMFQATRIPETDGVDTLQAFPDSKHILVQRGSRFYRVDVLDDAGNALANTAIADSIEAILREPSDNLYENVAVGALTLWGRDDWAATRKKLLARSGNEATMDDVDAAIFAVCLEDEVPDTDSEQLNRCLYGSSGRNRWHDKSFQVSVRPDGNAGITFEHSWGDGVAVLSYLTQVYDHAVKSDVVKPSENLSKPTELKWNVNEDIENDISAAVAFIDDFKNSVEGPSICQNCDAIGLKFAKANGMSPDALIQMAFQLAYYRVHGESASTYEASTTGMFKHGRTETIRSCSTLSLEMCKVFLDGSTTKQERQAALKAAVKHHSALANDAQRGNGWDRHLFALRKLSLQNGEAESLFFQDETNKTLSNIILSTSTLGNIPQLSAGGFNPVGEDCFAIGYGVEQESVSWMVSSHFRGSNELCDAIEQSAIDFRAAFADED